MAEPTPQDLHDVERHLRRAGAVTYGALTGLVALIPLTMLAGSGMPVRAAGLWLMAVALGAFLGSRFVWEPEQPRGDVAMEAEQRVARRRFVRQRLLGLGGESRSASGSTTTT